MSVPSREFKVRLWQYCGVHEARLNRSGEERGSVSGQGSNPRDQFHAKMEARQAKRKSSEGEIHCSWVVFRLQS